MVDLEDLPAEQGPPPPPLPLPGWWRWLRWVIADACGGWGFLEAKEDLIRRISLLKRNTMAAPFEKAIDEHHRLAEASKGFNPENAPTGDGSEVMVIRHREEEAMYIQASHDRVTVIFSTVFREETDRIFGKVFLSVRFGITPHQDSLGKLGDY